MLFLILALSAVAFLFWYACVRPLRYWSEKGSKQSKPWPILGDSWPAVLKQKSIAEMVEWLYQMYPKERYFGFYSMSHPLLMIRDPELIRQLTVKEFDHFTDHFNIVDASVEPLWGGNLLSLKGDVWRHMRATLSPCFTSSKMKFMFSLISEAAENFTKYFDAKNEDLIEVEMKDVYTRFCTDVIATMAFGIEVNSLKDQQNEFFVMGNKVTNTTSLKSTIKAYVLITAPKLAKYFKIRLFEENITSFFTNIIDETIELRESKGIIRPDMINLLLEAKKNASIDQKPLELDTKYAKVEEPNIVNKSKPKLNLSNEGIAAQALIFFFAGFDTMSTALCFGSYELALQREIQQKLREEILETLEECNGKLTYEALVNMKYMDMVVSEILRKWPPAVATDRECVKPYVIEPIRPGEKPISLDINDNIWIPIYAIHRDPSFYDEPDKFNPDRFSEENKHKIKPYTYIPFGVGPRNCIGSRYALLEFKATLFYLLAKYEIVPTQKTEIPLKLKKASAQFTAENGFWLGLKRIYK